MTIFTAETLDLSRIEPPPLVDTSFETLLAARLAHLQGLWDERRKKDPALPPLDTLMLESEPAVILTQEYAYGGTLVRQAINDAARSLRLAGAVGSALEHLAATYHGTQRRLLIAEDPATNTAAVYETDEELRSRAQLAPEALAEFGLAPGGYVYRIRSAFADRIKGARVINRGAGLVEVRVLGRAGDGTVSDALLGEIAAAFEPEDASQSTDILSIRSARVERYVADLTLVIPRGPDPEVLKAAAGLTVAAKGVELHRLGAPLVREALSSAAHLGPVTTVRVNSPAADWPVRPEVAPFMTDVRISTEFL